MDGSDSSVEVRFDDIAVRFHAHEDLIAFVAAASPSRPCRWARPPEAL